MTTTDNVAQAFEWRLIASEHPRRLHLDARTLRRACARRNVPKAVFNYDERGPRPAVPPVRFISWHARGQAHVGIVSSDPVLFVPAATAVMAVVRRLAPRARLFQGVRRKLAARSGTTVIYRAHRVVVRDWIKLRQRRDWREVLAERFQRCLLREARALGLDDTPIASGKIEVLGILREQGMPMQVGKSGHDCGLHAGLLWLLLASDIELEGSWFVGALTARGYGGLVRAATFRNMEEAA